MPNAIQVDVRRGKDGAMSEIVADAKKTGKAVGDELSSGFGKAELASTQAGKKVRENLDRFGDDAKRSGKAIGEGLARNLGEGLESLKGGLDIGSMLESSLGKLSGKGGALLGAGLALGGLLADGVSQGFEQNDIGHDLAAKIGAGGARAGELGKIAGELWAGGMADSLEEGAAAVQAVIQNKLIGKDASAAAISQLSQIAAATSRVVGEEAGKVSRAARQLLVNGLAKDATEAFDLMTKAQTDGINTSEDLVDTITEYSTKFRDLGLNGQESIGLISQAMKGGARDTDTAADALKEFAIRAQDGSTSTDRGFRAIGLSAKDMGAQIAAGGTTAHDALGKTLDAIRAIKDPAVQSQVAVDLFGTKAEDLGRALYSMDLGHAAEEFNSFAGSASNAADTMESMSDKFGSRLNDVKNETAGFLEKSVEGWTGLYQNVFGPEVLSRLDANSGKFRDMAGTIGELSEAEKARAAQSKQAWESEEIRIGRVNRTLSENIDLQHQAADAVLGLSNAQIGFEEAVDRGAEAVKRNGRNLDIHTESGRNNQQALNDLVDATERQQVAMDRAGQTTQDVAVFTGQARERFVALAMQMGVGTAEANAMADALKLIPGLYKARAEVDTEQAKNALLTLHGQLVDLTHRPWVASVAIAGSSAGGRYFLGMDHGGIVGGIGHAAEGGPRGSWTMVNEHGPEIRQLEDGSLVFPAAMSERLLQNSFGGGGAPSSGGGAATVTFGGDLNAYLAVAWMQAYRDGLIQIDLKR